MRYVIVAVLVLAVVGCGSEPEPPAKAVAKKKKPAPQQPAEPPRPIEPVPQDAYQSPQQALAAFAEASLHNEQKEVQRASQWLTQQGASAVPEVAGVLKDDAAPLDQRIAATRILPQLPGSKDALLQLVDLPEARLRKNVIEGLGRVKPNDSQILDALIALVDDSDPEIQRTAIRAIRNIGPQASRAAPTVQKVLDDRSARDIVRDEARATLKVIDTRRGLMKLNE